MWQLHSGRSLVLSVQDAFLDVMFSVFPRCRRVLCMVTMVTTVAGRIWTEICCALTVINVTMCHHAFALLDDKYVNKDFSMYTKGVGGSRNHVWQET